MNGDYTGLGSASGGRFWLLQVVVGKTGGIHTMIPRAAGYEQCCTGSHPALGAAMACPWHRRMAERLVQLRWL